MENRKENVKKALAISLSGTDMPTDDTLKLTKEYINGKIELETLQKMVIEKYKKPYWYKENEIW